MQYNRSSRTWISKVLLGSVVMLIAVSQGFAEQKPPFTVQTVLYQASAYGVSATLGSQVLVGPTALASLQEPCGSNNNNQLVTGTAAGVTLLPLLQAGVSNTTAQSFPTMQSSATADVVGVNLLAGVISAQEVKSVSTTILDSSGFHLNSTGSSFTNLSVLGIPYSSLPAPNTQVGLPGIGYVVLNEQIPFTNTKEGQLVVNMIHVYVTVSNPLGIPAGTQVVVSSATSGMVRAFAPAIVTGESFGTEVSVAGILNSSPSAEVMLPCYGTSGQTLTDSVASLNLAGVLTSGTIMDTGKSILTSPYSSGEMTTQVEGLNLLNGLISANVIYGRVDAVIDGAAGAFENAVGTFTNISVSGHPEITDSVPYNTSVNMVGLGTLYIKHVIRNYPNPNSTEIRMLELVVNQNNSYGLPIGADILIGDAQITMVPGSEP